MKLGRWLFFGGLAGAAGATGFWLARYLRPERSPLVLNGSVVVITGASSGIGRAYALAFARCGARVVLAARRADRLEAVRHEITPYATDVLVVPTDITDETQLHNLVETTLEHFGHIDILINNAGIGGSRLMQKAPLAKTQEVIDTNLTSAMLLTSLVLPTMMGQRSGAIINVSSVAGLMLLPGAVAYATSKAGLIAFSDSLRREVGPAGIDVISVMPRYTESEMVSAQRQAEVRAMGLGIDTAEQVAERTIQGMLRHENNIIMGNLELVGTLLARHFPWLVDLVVRYVFDPNTYESLDEAIHRPSN